MMNDGVKEIHGVRKDTTNRVTISEREEDISVVVTAGGVHNNIHLTVAEARYFADRLYRLAERVELRLKPPREPAK